MTDAPGKQQFTEDVYPEELDIIGKRRSVWELPPLQVGKKEGGKEFRPSVAHGIVGLALSGGGIRSATFNLGVLQVLAKRGLLKWFDYLSTVSGGGYIGCTLSTVLEYEAHTKHSPGLCLRHEQGREESDTLKYLRSGGNYLAPGGLLDLFRIPALLLRGIAINLLVIAPFIGFLALLSFWRHPGLNTMKPIEDFRRFFEWTPWAFGLFAVWIALFPLMTQTRFYRDYTRRSLYSRSFAILLLAVLIVPAFEALPWIYRLVKDPALYEYAAGAMAAGIATILPIARKMEISKTVSRLIGLLAGILGVLILLCLDLATMHFLFTEKLLPGDFSRAEILAAAAVGIYFFTRLFVNVNDTSMHKFYRDRLSKAYLFHPEDQSHADTLRLSSLDVGKSGAPYPLINAALNIPGTKDQTMQGRGADFFIFSPHWCGSDQSGYCKTSQIEEKDPNLNLGTCMAISGAAAAPHMGTSASAPLAFLFTILNIRLNYWMANPAWIHVKDVWNSLQRKACNVGPFYLLSEMFGRLNEKSFFINLSDGGHIENLGLYELLRRRCKYIVCCDAEQDRNLILSSLGKVTAYARMDHGISITWSNLQALKKNEEGYSATQWAHGTIDYGEAEKGRILYIKSSLSGNEPRDIATYHAKHPQFPHQSTGDQFFDESQFEAYRALGYFIASQLFKRDRTDVPDLEAWFQTCCPQSSGSQKRSC